MYIIVKKVYIPNQMPPILYKILIEKKIQWIIIMWIIIINILTTATIKIIITTNNKNNNFLPLLLIMVKEIIIRTARIPISINIITCTRVVIIIIIIIIIYQEIVYQEIKNQKKEDGKIWYPKFIRFFFPSRFKFCWEKSRFENGREGGKTGFPPPP